jgi:hypothetical protein
VTLGAVGANQVTHPMLLSLSFESVLGTRRIVFVEFTVLPLITASLSVMSRSRKLVAAVLPFRNCARNVV